MKLRTQYIVALALAVLSAALSAYYYPQLPETMATHWNASGQVDGSMPKSRAAFLVPAMTVALVGLFAVVPKVDPLGENIRAFSEQYGLFVVLFAAFMLYVHSLMLAWNLGYRFELTAVLAPAIAALYYYLGTLMDHVERNWFVGVRTPWTLSDDTVWRRTHDRAGTLFKLAAVVTVAGALVPRYAVYFIAAPAVAVSLYLVAYSYVEYRRTAA
ncbi:SdpI family protein [Halomicrococcus gelatinilyticus]|uniref:SdpI family protein n=1 Tax=Halomicrococcus gelatinilyticus TaxID=1702103 RepID=UPI002E16518F